MKQGVTISLWLISFIICLSASANDYPIQENYIISQAKYDIEINQSKAKISLELNVNILQDKWSSIKISPASAETSLLTSSADITLINDRNDNKLLFKKKGEYAVRCQVSIPIESAAPLKRISIPVLESTFSKLKIEIPEANIGVIVSPEVAYEQKDYRNSTLIIINSPAAEELSISWGPKEALEKPQDTKVTVETYAVIEKDMLTYQHALTFNLARQSLKSFQVALPADARILEVSELNSGDRHIDRWFTENKNGNNNLNIILEKAVYGINFSCMVLWEEPINSAKSFRISPADVTGFQKQSGKLMIIMPVNSILDEEHIDNLTKQTIFEGTAKGVGQRRCHPYTYNALPAGLTVSIKPKQPQIFASLQTIYSVRTNSTINDTRISLDIKNIGTDTLSLKLPTGLTNIFIKGDKLRSYKTSADRVDIILSEKVLGKAELRFSATGEAIQESEKNLTFSPLIVVDAVSSEYILALKLEDAECEPTQLSKLSQTNPSKIPAWLQEQKPSLVYESSASDWKLSTIISPLKPITSATMTEHINVTEDEINRELTIKLTVKKAPLFSIVISLPEGVQPTEVKSDLLKEWHYDESAKSIKASFLSGIKGEHFIQLSMSGKISQKDGILPIASAVLEQPLPKQLDYWVLFYTTKDISVKTSSLKNIQEISADNIPSMPIRPENLRLAFNSIDPKWLIGIQKNAELPHLVATSCTALIIREGQMQSITQINYRIKNGSVNRLQLKLQDQAINPEITGEDIKNTTFFNNIWEINLASRVRDNYTLSVKYDRTEPKFSPIELIDTELESGSVIIAAGNERTEISFGPDSANTLPVPVSEIEPKFPQAILKQLSFPPSLAMNFNKPDARVSFVLKTHELSSILPAKVISCDLFSMNRPNGKLLTYLNTIIENTAKQYLEIKLPAGATLWGAYVDDKPIKAVTKDSGEIMIPIMSALTQQYGSGVSKAARPKGQTSVVVAYVQDINNLLPASKINLQMPQSDINIQGATWHLFLPKGYYVSAPAGNMGLVYSDPDITFPSLVSLIFGSLFAFIARVWMAIPPWVKTLALSLLFIGLIVVILYFVVKILRLLYAFFELTSHKIKRFFFVIGSGAAVTVILIGFIFMSTMRLSEMKSAPTSTPVDRTTAETTMIDLISSGDGPSLSGMAADIVEGVDKLANKISEGKKDSPKLGAADAKLRIENTKEEKDNAEIAQSELGANTKELQSLRNYANVRRTQAAKPQAAKQKESKESTIIVDLAKEIPPPNEAMEELKEEEILSPEAITESEEDTDEDLTPSPLRGKGVYDTIGIGGGLVGGERRSGRKRIEMLSAEPTKPPPAPPTSLDGKSSAYFYDSSTTGGRYGGNASSRKGGDKAMPKTPKADYYGLSPDMAGATSNLELPVNGKLFGKTKQGRQSGALPITVAMPLHQAYYYAFESLYLGKSSGTVSFWCLSSGLMLLIQLLTCLVLGGIIFYISRFSVMNALYMSLFSAVIAFIGLFITNGILGQVFAAELAFSILLAIIILIYYKRSRAFDYGK
ncbi:MAG: hypothetical protein WC980_00830 [Candidatus Brocadiia bacterium]